MVGTVLPFKTNNYVVDELIDWNNIPNDEIFTLNFPRKELLPDTDFSKIAHLIKTKAPKEKLDAAVHKVRMALNPHPAGQQHNVPEIDGQKLEGMQHKYEETVLFFQPRVKPAMPIALFASAGPSSLAWRDKNLPCVRLIYWRAMWLPTPR